VRGFVEQALPCLFCNIDHRGMNECTTSIS
jgi:hypothetical protein